GLHRAAEAVHRRPDARLVERLTPPTCPGLVRTHWDVAGTTQVWTASRRRCAAVSGAMSLTQTAAPDSEPARYFSFPGARRIVKISPAMCQTSRLRRTGACCQPEMYGVGVSNSPSNALSTAR